MIRILIVEDSQIYAQYLEAIIAHSDLECEVYQVARIRDVKSVLDAINIDIIILDLKLPNGEGLEAITRITSIALDKRVLVITGREQDVRFTELVERHVDIILYKSNIEGRLIGYFIELLHLRSENNKLREYKPKLIISEYIKGWVVVVGEFVKGLFKG